LEVARRLLRVATRQARKQTATSATSPPPPTAIQMVRMEEDEPDAPEGDGLRMGGGAGGGEGAGMTTRTVCVATVGVARTVMLVKLAAAAGEARAVVRFAATLAAAVASSVRIVTVISTLAADTVTLTDDTSTPAPSAKRTRRSSCFASSYEETSLAASTSVTASCTSRNVNPGGMGGGGEIGTGGDGGVFGG